MDRSRIARRRVSMSHQLKLFDRSNGVLRDKVDYNNNMDQGRSLADRNGRRRSDDNERYGSNFRRDDSLERMKLAAKPPPLEKRERSLSPFSKRLALTQAMNMG